MAYNEDSQATPACTLETIDGAMYDFIERLNLHTSTNKGLSKARTLWLGTERVYQIKSDKRIRDATGALILPLVTINRASMVKDPAFKGSFQAHYPKGAEGSSTTTKRVPNQEKTSNFQTAEFSRDSKGTGYGKHEDGDSAIVYDSYNSPVPVYLTINYDITLRTEYQQQMNDLLLPFITSTGGINSFYFGKDGHRFEAFIQQEFAQNNNIANLGEQERIFETKVTIKVLGYLVGEGLNNKEPTLSRRENRAKIRFSRERTIVGDKVPWKDKDNDYRD
tara:strand:- start:33 stop:866 length:834 start_codon:yes stop_codon:yes gene_type:complete